MVSQRASLILAAVSLVWAGALSAACGDDDATSSDAGVDAGGSGGSSGHAGHGGGGAGGKGGGSGASTAGHGGSSGSSAGSGGGAAATREITLRFKAKVGDEDFACGKTYAGLGSSNSSATPDDFRFFVQDIALLRADGSEVPFSIAVRAPFQLSEVAMIDFTDGKGTCIGDAATNMEIVGTVAAGENDFDGIVFSNGVPDSLNHQNIALADPPLQNAGLYWGWLSGYRFLLAGLMPVGVGPAESDAGSDDDAGALGPSLLHTGSAACKGSNTAGFTCMRPNRNRVRLMGFDPSQHGIVADIARLFEQTDLSVGQQCHGAEPGCEELFTAYGVDSTTGQPLMTQRVFRSE